MRLSCVVYPSGCLAEMVGRLMGGRKFVVTCLPASGVHRTANLERCLFRL